MSQLPQAVTAKTAELHQLAQRFVVLFRSIRDLCTADWISKNLFTMSEKQRQPFKILTMTASVTPGLHYNTIKPSIIKMQAYFGPDYAVP